MDTELKDKIAKLPVWAKEHIRSLELRAAPNIEEIKRLHQKVESLEKTKLQQQDRIDAMVAMFQCAAKGGNEVAAAVQRIVEDFLSPDEE